MIRGKIKPRKASIIQVTKKTFFLRLKWNKWASERAFVDISFVNAYLENCYILKEEITVSRGNSSINSQPEA